ncbi:MAG: hypothetical protein AAF665_19260 [Pseudomonadota bacterium]
MRVVALTILAALALTACGPDEDDLSFDGQYYRSKVKADKNQREVFVVTARPASASLLGAREAARYEATAYCVNRYGRSDIKWVVGPDSPDEALTILNDTLTLQGECRQ